MNPDRKIVSFPAQQKPLEGRWLILAPGGPPAFECRGFAVSQASPAAQVQPGADVHMIRKALAAGILLDAEGGVSSALVSMTPISTSAIEPRPTPAPVKRHHGKLRRFWLWLIRPWLRWREKQVQAKLEQYRNSILKRNRGL